VIPALTPPTFYLSFPHLCTYTVISQSLSHTQIVFEYDDTRVLLSWRIETPSNGNDQTQKTQPFPSAFPSPPFSSSTLFLSFFPPVFFFTLPTLFGVLYLSYVIHDSCIFGCITVILDRSLVSLWCHSEYIEKCISSMPIDIWIRERRGNILIYRSVHSRSRSDDIERTPTTDDYIHQHSFVGPVGGY
jgi:hypothetical protein